MIKNVHIPVLQNEVLKYLNPKPNENFIDCTVGEGGHSTIILEKNQPNGKVLGIEIDPELYQKLKSETAGMPSRFILVNDSYINLKQIIEKYKFGSVSGILFDLGLSSWQLEKSGRGFSFQREEPLDMRYNPETTRLTAEKIINEFSEKDIEEILKNYGEEKFSEKISKEIIEARKKTPIKTTFQLVGIIKRTVPQNYEKGRIHPATRAFQALRIAVNDEIENFKKALPKVLEILEEGGRLVIISFHSLEDRIAKVFLKETTKNGLLEILTKKPVIPSKEEIKINPRSRSAKLRAAIKIK